MYKSISSDMTKITFSSSNLKNSRSDGTIAKRQSAKRQITKCKIMKWQQGPVEKNNAELQNAESAFK